MKTSLTELRTIIKDIILEELEEEDFDIPLPVLRVKSIYSVPKNFTGIAKEPDGTKVWFKDGKRHRENGPAIEHSDGTKRWFKNGKRHREDGPAVEYNNGTKMWYINGKRHREDGPAIIEIEPLDLFHPKKEYWLNNKKYSQEEYENIMRNK